jgi:hypothetical protein
VDEWFDFQDHDVRSKAAALSVGYRPLLMRSFLEVGVLERESVCWCFPEARLPRAYRCLRSCCLSPQQALVSFHSAAHAMLLAVQDAGHVHVGCSSLVAKFMRFE